MSGQEEEESPEIPSMNLFLQESVYALMADFGIQINPNPNPRLESQQESSRGTARSIRIIEPALPLNKRSFESTGGVYDSEENEKNKKNKKEDEKPRRESSQDSEDNGRKKQEEDQEPRTEPVEYSLESQEKMEEDDQEPRTEPAQGETLAEDSDENESKKQEDDQGLRIEPAVQDSQEDEKRKKEDDAAEGSKKNEISEEVQDPRDEYEDSPVFPLYDSDHSPSSPPYDFRDALAMPVRRRLFNENDEPDDYQKRSTEVKIREDSDSQIAQNVTNWTHLDTELAIFDGVIRYKVNNGRNPFPDNCDLADFIKNWLRIDVPVKEFHELITYLRKKYVKRDGKRPLNESSSDAKDEKVLDFAHKIWE